MREISYLKSFRIQDDDRECGDNDHDDEDDDDETTDESTAENNNSRHHHLSPSHSREARTSTTAQQRDKKKKKSNYFHYIRFAIEHATLKSSHVNMQPCYGYDLTPSSGHLLDASGGFIETSLPPIQTPHNDFHSNLLQV